MYFSMNRQNDYIQVHVLNSPLMTGSSWCILSTNRTQSTLVKRRTYGTCIKKGAGTSSLLATASESSMMNWEVAAAKLKWHMALSSVEFKKHWTAALFLKVTYHIQQSQFVPYIYHCNIKITLLSFVFKNLNLKFSFIATTWTYFLQDIMVMNNCKD